MLLQTISFIIENIIKPNFHHKILFDSLYLFEHNIPIVETPFLLTSLLWENSLFDSNMLCKSIFYASLNVKFPLYWTNKLGVV